MNKRRMMIIAIAVALAVLLGMIGWELRRKAPVEPVGEPTYSGVATGSWFGGARSETVTSEFRNYPESAFDRRGENAVGTTQAIGPIGNTDPAGAPVASTGAGRPSLGDAKEPPTAPPSPPALTIDVPNPPMQIPSHGNIDSGP